MKLIPIGTGSAFTMKDFQSNFILESDDIKYRLLIDAGSDIRFSLKEQGLTYKDINAIFISHLHADHSGGLEYLGFCSYFDPTKDKIKLFGHRDVLANVLPAGMLSVQGKVMALADYFDVRPLEGNESFLFIAHTEIIQVIHVYNGYSLIPSYGLMIHDDQSFKKLFITTDTQHAPNQIMDFYKQADCIVQDCETMYKSGVHAHYDELRTLPIEVKSKMWLTHYQDNVRTDNRNDQGNYEIKEEWVNAAKNDGFRGFCRTEEPIVW